MNMNKNSMNDRDLTWWAQLTENKKILFRLTGVCLAFSSPLITYLIMWFIHNHK
jgi:hypothetical protein